MIDTHLENYAAPGTGRERVTKSSRMRGESDGLSRRAGAAWAPAGSACGFSAARLQCPGGRGRGGRRAPPSLPFGLDRRRRLAAGPGPRPRPCPPLAAPPLVPPGPPAETLGEGAGRADPRPGLGASSNAPKRRGERAGEGGSRLRRARARASAGGCPRRGGSRARTRR